MMDFSWLSTQTVFITYLVMVIVSLGLARYWVNKKRNAWNKDLGSIDFFSYDHRLKAFTLLAWSSVLIFSLAILVPIFFWGRLTWSLFIFCLIFLEAFSLLAGSWLVSRIGIMNWYIESQIASYKSYKIPLGHKESNHKWYEISLALIIVSFILENIAYGVEFAYSGILLQLIALIPFGFALYVMIEPFKEECDYYCTQN